MNLDSFAAIAARRAMTRDALRTPTPEPRPVNRLPLGPAREPWSAPPPLATQEALEAELGRMRESHAPYLRELAPAPTFRRVSLPLQRWQRRLETPEDRADFQTVLAGLGTWKELSLPHYEGPIGLATTYYRTEIALPELANGQEWSLAFEAADYHARVYCNGRCVGEHEGFYAPFEFAIHPYLKAGEGNVIVVELRNDAVCKGQRHADGSLIDGDKLYAATGPGWDDPALGWHHCPPGMGLFGAVTMEARAATLWVRTLNLEGDAELLVELSGRDFANPPVTVRYAIHGENFSAEAIPWTEFPLPTPVGRGANLYRVPIKIPRPRLWSPATPWLYSLEVILLEEGRVTDGAVRLFGLRTFVLDTEGEPKGEFRLNGEPLRLMGANTMGFEQQDVMRGDLDQLRDDLLLAKMTRMNFLRLTRNDRCKRRSTRCAIGSA